MPLTLVTTGTDANTYCSLEAAEAYWATLTFSTALVGKTDEQKKAALIQATRTMDDVLQWKGRKGVSTQALEWPRLGVVDRNGYAVDYTIIPTKVRDACAHQALWLLEKDRLGSAKSGVKLGTIQTHDGKREPIAPAVRDMVSQYVQGSGSILLVRG